MPRLIFKCPYIKGGGRSAASHLNNYVSYMATRPGVECVEEDRRPATKKQQEMVRQLLHEFPLSGGMHEYQDYQASPTRANATEFISRALEENMDEAAKKENYLQYIAQRPNVQAVGSHGLFSGSDEPLVLSKIAEEVAQHPGSVWLPIISLRREDAARLGYDNVKSWQALLTGNAMRIAEAMKIPWDQFRWYAAFHDQTHHPHVHMVCYSADGKSGYLTKEGIAQVKSMLAREIFRQDLTEVYQRQTQRRDELVQTSGKRMAELIRQMQTGTVDNEHIGQLLAQLAERLKHTSGKKQYGYLRPPLKALVDEIVDELARDPCVSTAYDCGTTSARRSCGPIRTKCRRACRYPARRSSSRSRTGSSAKRYGWGSSLCRQTRCQRKERKAVPRKKMSCQGRKWNTVLRSPQRK